MKTTLTQHEMNMLDEANMRLSVVSGTLLNDECERKLTRKMSQAKNDIFEIQSALRKFYKTYQ